MALAVIQNYTPLPGLGEAIMDAGYPIVAVMQPDQVTQIWMTDADALSAVQAIIAAHDPLPAARQPYLDALAALLAAKLAAGYRHSDGHVYQLGADRLGSTGAFNLSAIAALCTQALAGIDQAWPNGSFIRDAANTNVVYSAGGALALCTLAGAYVTALRKRYWGLKAAIEASAAPASIDIASGWPG